MEKVNYEEYYQSEKIHWWHRGRRHIIFTLLDQHLKFKPDNRILDVGCGCGTMLKELSVYGEVVGIELSEKAINFCRKKGYTNLSCASAQAIPFSDNTFNLVTILDTLEHTEDDLKSLQELYRVCQKGGLVLITVPAFNFLWGDVDELCGHKQRYISKELKTKMQAVGFQVLRLSYINMFLFLPTYLLRIYKKLFNKKTKPNSPFATTLPSIVNLVLESIFKFEAFWVKRGGMPFGVSIIALGEKI